MCRTGVMAAEECNPQSQCEQDNQFFKSILDLIPPIVYFNTDTKQKIIDESEAFESEGKTKRNRKKGPSGDVFQTKTVSQIQETLDKLEKDGGKRKTKKRKAEKNQQEFQNSISNIGMLQKRLHEKLDTMKGNRKSITPEERKARRQIKQQEKKLRRKMKNNVKKTLGNVQPHGGVRIGSPTQTAKPVYDKEGKIVFSKFDFSQTNKKQKSKTGLVGKDYKKLLEKLERKKSEFEKLREKDAKAANELEAKDKWNTAMSKAEGEKVKDNPQLLKNAIKRKEKNKEKHKKKWDDRQKTVEVKKQAKQDKRERNLDKRKQGKKDKKKKKMIKKGRIIPGF
ncbi:hypothetical protein LOTGIDRAFT_231867 [Lottia gigantea]|uniref:Ribosomal RNA-processing protein 14/surfeit locus protein 6 C-terminal domain-containing protein n=1 Tax=Lottia gigantea TaxID=225164 RepID=V4AN25_LOTGI|nr:hypothetical protein LOTGIDRAFT_231867 [Lottia gigantea]ESO96180.1 hypothetical protein LOTGIDRAFT_231867 [Lottia gigantea]